MNSRRPPLPPAEIVTDPDLGEDERDLALVEETASREWGGDDNRKTRRVPALEHRAALSEALRQTARDVAAAFPLPPTAPEPVADPIPIYEVPETIPPDGRHFGPAPAYMPAMPAIASPFPRRAPVERAARRLAWVLATCTLALVAAILVAALLLRGDP